METGRDRFGARVAPRCRRRLRRGRARAAFLAALLALPLGALVLPAATATATPGGPVPDTAPASTTATEPPLPLGAGGPPVFNLAGWHLACPSTSWCLLTGVEETASQLYLAIAATWSSGSWTDQLLAVPSGGLSGEGARPTAVTCTAPGTCVVVGDYSTSAGVYGLADTLSGGSWSSQQLAGPPSANQSAELGSVACASAASCVAAGQYELTAYNLTAPFVATLSGGSWTTTAVPTTAGMTSASLASIACPSASSCVAVGSQEDSSSRTYGLLDTLAGGSWSAAKAAVSGGLASPGSYSSVSALNAVSCTAVGACVAAGTFEATTYAQYPLIDRLASGTWSGVDAGTTGGSPQVDLLALSCYQGTLLYCEAVGWWNDNYGNQNPLLETYNGSSWAVSNAPQPSDHGTAAGSDESSELTTVSCPASTCTAAGSYETSSKTEAGLFDTQSFGASAAQTVAAPAPSDVGSYGGGDLTALACPAVSTCVAAGIYQDYAGNYDGMTEVGSGSSFTATKVTAPATPPLDPAARLAAVACPTASGCVGVGYYDDALREQHAVIETESGGTWQAADAPLPAGAGTDATDTQGASLSAVSCPAAGSCVAVGDYKSSAGLYLPLVEVESGGSWSALGATLPADARSPGFGMLSAVSCSAPGTCVAVGRYFDSAAGFKGLIGSLQGGTLSLIGTPEPAGAGLIGAGVARMLTSLDSVSCTSDGSCVAVGAYPDSSGKAWGLIDVGSGTTWSAIAAPQPAGAAAESGQMALLSGASCPATGTCFATGYYTDSTPSTEPLIETLAGGAWTPREAPKPSTASSGSGSYSRLSAISCADATDCTAVGEFTAPSSNYAYWSMVDTLSASSWSAAPAADPAGAGTGANQYELLDQVDCPSAAWCVAAGVYRATSGSEWPYLATGAGSSWSLSAVALPANATSQALGLNASTAGLACSGAGACEVSGAYLDSGPTTEPFVDALLPAAPSVTGVSPAGGPAAGGTTVTVTGSGFFPGSTATVGGAAASVTYQSPTSLQVQAPPGHGTVDVEVTTDGGTSAGVPADTYAYAPAPQTVAFVSSPAGPTYGGGYTPVATASSGLAVTYAVDPTSGAGVCTYASGSVSFTGVGTCVLDASQAGDADNAPASTTQSFSVAPASQSVQITSSPADAIYGGTYSPAATASSGLPVAFSVDPSSGAGACSLSSGTGGVTVNFGAVGTCVLDAGQAGDADYLAASPALQSIPVGSAPQSIAFTSTEPAAATYGGSYTPGATATSGLPVAFSVDASSDPGACAYAGGTVSFTGTGTCVLDADQAGSSDWSSAPEARQTIDVARAAQTVGFTSTPTSPTFGGSFTPAATASSGLAASVTVDASSDPSACTLATGTVSFTGVGTCVLDAGQAGNGDYLAAAPVALTIDVAPAPETVGFVSIAPAFATVGGSYQPVALASSKLPVTFAVDSSSGPGACAYSGGTVLFTGPGTCVLDADQAGGSGYAEADPAQQHITVGAATTAALTGVPAGPVAVGTALQLGLAVTPAPSGGTADFSLDSGGAREVLTGCTAVPLTAGAANCTWTPTAAGSTTIIASFSGVGATVAATASATVTVAAPVASLSLALPSGLDPGSQVAVTVGVGGTQPGGASVLFRGPAGASLGTGCSETGVAVVDGAATCTFPASTVTGDSSPTGSYTVTAKVICATCTQGSPVTAAGVVAVVPAGMQPVRLSPQVSPGDASTHLSFGGLVRLRLAGAAAATPGRVSYLVAGRTLCTAPTGGSCLARLPAAGQLVVLGVYSGPAAVVVGAARLAVGASQARWQVRSSRAGGLLRIAVVARPEQRLPVADRPRGTLVVRSLGGRLLGRASLRPLPGGSAVAAWSGPAPGPVRVVVVTGSDYEPPAPVVIGG